MQLLDTQAPTVVKNNDLQCLDYGYTNFLNNPTWIDQAEQMGLYLNAWTIDDKAYMVRFNNLGVDYITSNYPEIVQQLYELFKDMMPDSDMIDAAMIFAPAVLGSVAAKRCAGVNWGLKPVIAKPALSFPVAGR